ncbi:MAG: hypothetical protein RL204_737 [Bacteroidota bacterium]|jgi:hypothetical protein
MKRLSSLLVILLMTIASAWSQNNLYVSVFGNNAMDGLTQITPVRDVQHAINISNEGDTINIFGGDYYEYLSITHDNLTIRRGSIFDDVVIKPSMGDIVENALLLIDGKSNILIDGITFAEHMYNYAQGIYVRGAGSNIDIINCRVHDIHFSEDPGAAVNEDTNAQAIIVEGTEELSNINIIGCEVYDCRLGYSEGIAINGNVTYFNVSENYVHDLTNIGIVAIGHEGVCKTPAVDQARFGVIAQNTVMNCISPYATCGGVYVDGGAYISVERNHLEHNGYGVEVGCEHVGKVAEYVVVKNNLLIDNEVAGAAIGGYDFPNGSGMVQYIEVRHNTFYKNNFLADYTGEFLFTYMQNFSCANNIFYLNDQGVLGYAENQGTNLIFNHNVIYQEQGIVELDWFGVATETFNELMGVLALNAGGQYGDPLFADAEGGDFHIMEGSEAIAMALQAADLQDGETDYYGEARHTGLLDCGADEYGMDPVSIVELEPIKHSVYPNPFINELNIVSEETITSYAIFDAVGRRVVYKEGLEVDNLRIDTSRLRAGVYTLVVNGKGSLVVRG